jgi:hypothetical protein
LLLDGFQELFAGFPVFIGEAVPAHVRSRQPFARRHCAVVSSLRSTEEE